MGAVSKEPAEEVGDTSWMGATAVVIGRMGTGAEAGCSTETVRRSVAESGAVRWFGAVFTAWG